MTDPRGLPVVVRCLRCSHCWVLETPEWPAPVRCPAPGCGSFRVGRDGDAEGLSREGNRVLDEYLAAQKEAKP